ncbi:uncharacterized protein EDB93DRAFT_1244841 [Suillus bovinus]|uniref:uncharacterized protein n=1 Tax=Suillus bovinus TaxID=48563 RepID=UPI001B885EC3|nr:uncharacterized protein EDB93DRAFT_1244841 [Suillus bovinus]KAG2160095.1 hypothetical protein EDB93DRAFT_1244841 [Suillus bovinus]
MEHRSDYNSAHGSFATKIFSGTNVDHTTTAIIVVLCIFAGMLILFGLFRFLRHRLARRSTPLPPVQPIAHFRKQRLTEFAARPPISSTYSLSSHLSPSNELLPAASDSSCLTTKYNQTFHSQSSLYLADKNDHQGVPPSPVNDEEVMPTPNPAFHHARRFSSSSSGSISSTPPSASISSRSPSQTTLTHPYSRHTGPALAMSSTSIRSRSSGRSTIVGAPHGPMSQVRLVLPAPLAPSLHPYLSGSEAGRLGVNAETHRTMVDMWAPPLHRSASSDHIRSNSAAISATYPHGSLPSKPRQRTSSCHTPSSSYHSSVIGSPPVPPIPSQYQQLNGVSYATQHQQDPPTRSPLVVSQSSSEESYTSRVFDRISPE